MAGVLIGLCLYMSPASNVFHTVSTERRALQKITNSYSPSKVAKEWRNIPFKLEVNNFSLKAYFAPPFCWAWGKCPRCPALGTALGLVKLVK